MVEKANAKTAPGPAPAAPWFCIHSRTLTQPQLVAAGKGLYHYGGHAIRLTVPVDWSMDPHHDRTWRYYHNSLAMLEPLLRLYLSTRRTGLLTRAIAFALDYMKSCIDDGAAPGEFVWYDMAVAQRLCYLVFLFNEGRGRGVLDDDQAEAIVRCCHKHAAWLMEPQNYAYKHNHGLFCDAALAIAAKGLPHLAEAAGWKQVADSRFLDNLLSSVGEDHVHLEHSPMYHFVIIGLTTRLRDYVELGGKRVEELVGGMREVASWLVMPDNRLPLVGDTNYSLVGRSWQAKGDSVTGLAHFAQSGYQIAKDKTAYLFFSSAFHSPAHKHTDELSFEYMDGGRRIVVDSGNYGYFPDTPGRRYCVSAEAHNTLTIDNVDFGRSNRAPFGSGTLECGDAEGWYMLSGHNPRLRAQHATHRRLLFLRPGRFLIVCDEVEPSVGWQGMQISRHFHLDPAMSVQWHPDRKRHSFSDAVGRGEMVDFNDAGTVLHRLVRGRLEPRIQGIVYRRARDGTPNPTFILQYRAAEDGRPLPFRKLRFRTVFSLEHDGEIRGPVPGTVADVDAWISTTVPSDLIKRAGRIGFDFAACQDQSWSVRVRTCLRNMRP